MANVEVKCALCGQGSHREDWQGKSEVFCDTHSTDDVKAFQASKAPAPLPAVKPVAPAPVAPAATPTAPPASQAAAAPADAPKA